MEKKTYLTTGRFAKMCGTTKDTLFHYDRLGILKPKYVSANGYRRYRAEQFFEFDLISVLKEAGGSLDDVKKYMADYEVGHLLDVLDDKIEALEEQQKRLAGRLEALRHISALTRSAIRDDYGVIRVEQQAEEKLLAQELGLALGQSISWDETALYLSAHLSRCRELGLGTVFPVGAYIPASNLSRGVFTESHFFSIINEEIEGVCPLIKPAGSYAVFYHQGSYDSLTAAFPGYLEKIAQMGLSLSGGAYLYALLSYLASEDEDNDVHKVAVAVS